MRKQSITLKGESVGYVQATIAVNCMRGYLGKPFTPPHDSEAHQLQLGAVFLLHLLSPSEIHAKHTNLHQAWPWRLQGACLLPFPLAEYSALQRHTESTLALAADGSVTPHNLHGAAMTRPVAPSEQRGATTADDGFVSPHTAAAAAHTEYDGREEEADTEDDAV